VALLIRLQLLTTAVGSGFGEYLQKSQVGLHPIEEGQSAP
jgi:hypothetical protein